MRYASFAAETNGEKADISVVTFAGDGGSDADNVNRWRQQIGLPAVEAGALDSMIVPVQGSEITVSMSTCPAQPRASSPAGHDTMDGFGFSS